MEKSSETDINSHLIPFNYYIKASVCPKGTHGRDRWINHQKGNSCGRKMCSVLLAWRAFRSHENLDNLTDVSIDRVPECKDRSNRQEPVLKRSDAFAWECEWS